MRKKAPTREESAYLERVKNLPCQCCGAPGPSSAHHPREGQGMAQRAGHFCATALCYDCHQGPQGIHGDQTYLRIYKLNEMDLIDKTVGAVMRNLLGASR